jgi:hypothetical protein
MVADPRAARTPVQVVEEGAARQHVIGRGDGCIAVESTRLEGVADQQTIHANHLELIRAPLFYPDPGPVVSMPYILRWLEADLPVAGKT